MDVSLLELGKHGPSAEKLASEAKRSSRHSIGGRRQGHCKQCRRETEKDYIGRWPLSRKLPLLITMIDLEGQGSNDEIEGDGIHQVVENGLC